MVNATETEKDKMLAWIDSLSNIEPKERAQQIFNHITMELKKFAADVLFYRQKPESKLDLYVAKSALEIMKSITPLIPPV